MKAVPALDTIPSAQSAEAAHLSVVIAQREILLGQLPFGEEAHTLHSAMLALERQRLADIAPAKLSPPKDS